MRRTVKAIDRFTCDRCGEVKEIEYQEGDGFPVLQTAAGWMSVRAENMDSNIIGGEAAHLCVKCSVEFRAFMEACRH